MTGEEWLGIELEDWLASLDGRYEQHESIELAFVSAWQNIPAMPPRSARV